MSWAAYSESLALFLAPGDQLFSEQASMPGFLVWPDDPGPVHGGFEQGPQQALEDAGQLCRVCVRAARAAGLLPEKARDRLEESSLPFSSPHLPRSSRGSWLALLACC